MTKPNFKRTRFFVANNAEGEQVQKAMFALGFKWAADSAAGKQREVRDYFSRGGFIYVDGDCRLTTCSYESPIAPYNTFAPALQRSLFVAAEEHRKVKRIERKASRKRKALRSQGWIINDGTQPAIEGKIEVLFNEGTTDDNHDAATWTWQAGEQDWCIHAWRPARQALKTVSLQEMVQGIVKDADGVEVQHVDSDGFIRWDGVDRRVANFSEYSGPVPLGTKVDVKYRNGTVRYALTAGSQGGAAGSYWRKDDFGFDIVAYRLCPTVTPAAPKPEPVATVEAPDTNPKRQYGVSSVPLNMWSQLASAYGALALHNGALKYGKANFANTPVEASIYIAAAYRHLSAWAAGQEFDPADGVPNLGGALANIAILLEARAAGTLIDDRLRMDGYLKEIDKLKEIAKSLNDLHAGKNPKHYTLGE